MTEQTRLPAIFTLVGLIIAMLAFSGAGVAQTNSSGTVVKVGSDYTIAADAVHVGDVVIFGGDVTVDGELNGRAIAVGGAVRVSGDVHGDVIALGGRAVLAEGASITGGVTAVGGGVQRADHVKLRGEVNSIILAHGLSVPQFNLFPFNLRSFPVYSLYLIGLYLSALIIAFVFADQAAAVERTLMAHPGKASLVGLLILLLIVPLTIVMALSVVGLPLVLLAWITFFIGKLLGYMAVAAYTGRLLLGKWGLRLPLWLRLAVGVVALGFLRAVPYAGMLFGLLVLIMGLGAAFMAHFGVRGVWWPFVARDQDSEAQS